MEIDLALLADAATIDGSGKLNVLGIFDRITVAALPAQHARMALVVRFVAGSGDEGTHQVQIRLTGPGGDEILRLDGTIQIGPRPRAAQGGFVRVPHVLNLEGVAFREAGAHAFEVRVDGRHHTTIPLQLATTGGSGGRGFQA